MRTFGVVVGTLLLAAISACGNPPASAPAPAPAPSLTSGAPSAMPSPQDSPDPGDVGSGEPGAFCATSRLGKTFVKDGITYVCEGPKPYRWRKR